MSRFLWPCAVLAVLTLSACADTAPRWVAQGRSADRAGDDLSQCRHEAESRLGPVPGFDPGDERTGDPMKMVARTKTADRYDALVGDCMESRGYQPDR